MTMKSQTAKIRAALEEGRTLTAIDALEEFDCFRLAARIAELRGAGCSIRTLTRNGKNGKRFAAYQMAAVS